MNIDDLTIGQAKTLAAQFAPQPQPQVSANQFPEHVDTPVLVCTEKRGVVFGTTTSAEDRPIRLTGARMCLYWSADVGGVFGLAEKGPTKGCKISAVASVITLEGVTAVFAVEPDAVKAWRDAPIQGR